jgi:DHA1 family bicyclomycin/chloramphenicol resistance-like MFS transporter
MCGLMSGSWVTSRLAGKRTPEAAVTYGYIIMGSAALLNLVINLTLPPAVPWNVIPIFIYTFGMALTTPSLTLFALDNFPAQRGLAASCQTFLQAGFNGFVAAIVAPLVWGSTLTLALAMTAFVSLGALASYLQRRSALLPR